MKKPQTRKDTAGRFDLIGNTPGGGLALDPAPFANRLEAAASAIECEPWAWTLGFGAVAKQHPPKSRPKH
jgi:hypothetical protein